MIDAANLAADFRRGFGASLEDIVVAALVVLPFTGTLAILLHAMTGLPDAAMVVVTGLLQGLATFWNAGWRARTGTTEDPGH